MPHLFAALLVTGIASQAGWREQIRLPAHAHWQVTPSGQVEIWTGKQEAWRLTLSSGCPSPKPGQTLTLLARKGHLQTRQPIFPAADKRCTLIGIEPSPVAGRTMPDAAVIRLEAGTSGNSP